MDTRDLELKSSALTLSDMEIFVFPELMYSLVLANIMSPRLWRWREDPWFAGLDSQTPYRRIVRLKQYIMDHYAFNLDLDTWGLTTKPRELARFAGLVDPKTLEQSNALFGYEGDKYYFDLDIRRHFGLDRYDGDVIPYWKTETVEAMDAFRFRPNYTTGAGECVSLATLYAAALFVVARIPLRDVYLMATPLHSQNFVDLNDGILTNNRRLVTKAMWFNGTALSAQARRALEHERVTVVAHETGHVHILYPEFSMDPAAYARFSERLDRFLHTGLSPEMLGNYVRHRRDIQKCFQVRHHIHGVPHYIGAERAFAYEEGSPFKLTDPTRAKLLDEIERESFTRERLSNGIVLNDLEDYLRAHRIDLQSGPDLDALRRQFSGECLQAALAIEGLIRFCRTVPRLPELAGKTRRSPPEPLGLTLDMDREAVLRRLREIRAHHPVADLAFYSYRDVTATDSRPFLKAALERSPVCIQGCTGLSDAEVAARLAALPNESIYDGPGRLAQPDEVWNFGRGDGLERALLLAAVLRARAPDRPLTIEIGPDSVAVRHAGAATVFETAKGVPPSVWPVT